MSLTQVDLKAARYIKLGSAKENVTDACLKAGEAFVHFGTTNPEVFALARNGDWDAFRAWRRDTEQPRVDRGEIKPSAADSNATSATSQVRAFVEDDGATLWFTFHGGRLFWAFLDKCLPTGPDSTRGFVRETRDGWRDTDISGNRTLHYNELSGRLTRTAAYRSTTCAVSNEARDYLWRRLQGIEPTESRDARASQAKLVDDLQKVIAKFTFKDFELLAELVLTSVGWRRQSLTGSAMPYVDIVLEQPLDRRVIGAQVKAVLSAKEAMEYADQFQESYSASANGPFQSLYYIYHSDPAKVATTLNVPSGFVLMGPEQIANLALRAGLVDWVIERIE
jgi:hypothetical protein